MPKNVSPKTILIATNLDTRGAAFARYKELMLAQGLNVILLDFSMEREPPFPGDITCDEVSAAGGLSIEEVRRNYATDRKVSTDCMTRGGAKIVADLAAKGAICGMLGVGGATATLIATSIMSVLPFGFPKLMATSVASLPLIHQHRRGIDDIAMLNTVVDVLGSNPLLDRALVNAVAAICGMVQLYPGVEQAARELSSGRPIVGITNFGLAERPVERCAKLLEEVGFQPVPFHAQGQGDRAMDAMIRQGVLAGVVDMVPRGIAEQLFGGDCPAGDDRLLATAEMGLPQVVAPGGFDQLTLGLKGDWRERFGERAYTVLDEMRVELRTLPAECRLAATVVAERLNRARAPFLVLIPTGGFSSLSRQGSPLCDPEADEAFVQELLASLDDPSRVRRIDVDLYSPLFGDACAAAFQEVWTENRPER
jgi:uncharacterized protein (UPF0261 family)